MQKTFLYEWKDLDLRKADQRPENGKLVMLKLTPKKPICAALAGPNYDIGRFEERNGKTIWSGAHQSYSASLLKREYEIRWCYAPEDR